MSQLRAVLLDLDGTLIDSNDLHAEAWVEVLAEYGHDVPFEKLRRLIGKGGDKLLQEGAEIDPESEQGEKIRKTRSERFMSTFLPKVRAFPQAEQLLRRLRDAGLRLVVATSAQEDEMEKLIRLAGAEGLLYEATSSSEAKNSKPDPDIILAAVRKSECRAEEAIMLGDTPYDIEAATRSGVRTVALRCGGWGDTDLAGALAIYDDPADLLAHFDESPFGRART